MINLELLKTLKACDEGYYAFKNKFGLESPSCKSAFSALGPEYTAWFIGEAEKAGALNPDIRKSIPFDFNIHRLHKVRHYIRKDFENFLSSLNC